MGAAREKDQSDFDLERFIDMFDTAMTSSDPRVVETLRKLMMIVALTAPETGSVAIDRQRGPLRRLYDDVYHLNNRLHRMEDEIHQIQRDNKRRWEKEVYPEWDDKYTLKAAAQMAQSIDDDVVRSIARQINSPGLNQVQPKGLLKK